ncbi:MAG: arylesterase [bacterium]
MSVPTVFSSSYGPLRALRNVAIAFCLWLMAANTGFAEKLTIVALGDSLTAGYGLAPDLGFVPVLQGWLKANGYDVTVENAGVSGDTTAGGLARLDWALSPDADAMIVNLGGNDLLRGLAPAQAQANIDKILATAEAKHLPVLLVGLKALNNYGPDYKAEFDAIYPALAAKYHTLYIDDYFGPIKSSQAELTANVQADGLHPNAKGVVKIVAAMGPMVEKLLAEVKP